MFNIKNNCFNLIQKSCTPPSFKNKYSLLYIIKSKLKNNNLNYNTNYNIYNNNTHIHDEEV